MNPLEQARQALAEMQERLADMQRGAEAPTGGATLLERVIELEMRVTHLYQAQAAELLGGIVAMESVIEQMSAKTNPNQLEIPGTKEEPS